MANARLFEYWNDLTEALRTGKPQNEVKHTGRPMFESVYADGVKLEGFMQAMTGISMGNFNALADAFDFSRYRTVCDVGGATGQLAIALARRHGHLTLESFDLPAVEPIAQRTIRAAGLEDRIAAVSGNFFDDPLPRADVLTMGQVLHNWNLEQKQRLIRAAFDAVLPGGAFIAIENIIDDERRQNAFGLMMSLNMLIEFGDAFDYTGRDFDSWCRAAGFERTEIVPLAGPSSAAIAYKAR